MEHNINGLRTLAFALLYCLISTLLGCVNHESDQPKSQTGNLQPLTKHWEKAIPHQKPPEGLESISARECGLCHEQIYREWQASNHAIALQDPQFQAEWAKDEHLWVCLNCHTPLQNQQEFVILGKQDGDYFKPVKQANPHFDAALKEESITCAVCHVRAGAVIGTRGNQSAAPHAVKRDSGLLAQEICLSCHNVEDTLTPTLVCSFRTGEEWKDSPYPQTGRGCITCHMPKVYRPLTSGGSAQWTRRHTWVGSAIPKFVGTDSIVEGYNSGLAVDVQLSPGPFTAGNSAFATITLTNQSAGHYLPTGDPEYFITLDLRVVDEKETTLQDTTFRLGQEWEWWPEARKLSDNRLKPLEQRNYIFAFAIPGSTRSLVLAITVRSHRMTTENAKAMGLLGKYPLATVIYQRRISIL
jgi:hypothetical protein